MEVWISLPKRLEFRKHYKAVSYLSITERYAILVIVKLKNLETVVLSFLSYWIFQVNFIVLWYPFFKANFITATLCIKFLENFIRFQKGIVYGAIRLMHNCSIKLFSCETNFITIVHRMLLQSLQSFIVIAFEKEPYRCNKIGISY